MKVAITGGTGFVGSHLARRVVRAGAEVVLLGRRPERLPPDLRASPSVRIVAADVSFPEALERSLAGCDAVAHCAGINREIGQQTYARIHVEGTRNVVDAARRAGLSRIALVSFLRARPECGSPYHESKWAAEEIVRGSGLEFTILKPGVIHGRGDHMLDHLSRALHTFHMLPLVGLRTRFMRPVAVEDVARVLEASVLEGRLARRTAFVLGPDRLTFREAVLRVARAARVRALVVPSPVTFHRAAAILFEATMTTPLASRAQVRILAEGLDEPAGPCEPLPDDLLPRTPFSEEIIRRGLPEPGPFTLADFRLPPWRGLRRGTGAS